MDRHAFCEPLAGRSRVRRDLLARLGLRQDSYDGAEVRRCPALRSLLWGFAAVGMLGFTGCTSLSAYVHNGFKVGPNYCRPGALVAERWIDENDKRIRTDKEGLNQWWTVLGDPILNDLVECAYRQNLTLREAGFRVLEARAMRGIAVGNIFPQSQTADGGYTRQVLSEKVANHVSTPDRWYSQWNLGFGLGWEVDFWGRFRRAIEAADAELSASVEDYDDVLVTLLADVGTNYVEIRTLEKRIELAQTSVQLFGEILKIPEAQFKASEKNRISYDMAKANLAQAQGLVPQLEIARRQAENRLCILLGMPPRDMQQELGAGDIPKAPLEVVVGIPADLLRRRPDVRRAERNAAAQSARIGIAESDFYPQFSVTGTFGYSSKELTDLFNFHAMRGGVGPGVQWNILNYGRILNNVRFQDARFQELVTQYQRTVLKAGGEVEDALISFVKSQERAKALATCAGSWRDGATLLAAQFRGGLIDFLPLAYFEQNLLEQQDRATQAQGDVPLALVEIYRALGGGWQIRLNDESEAVGRTDAEISPSVSPLSSPPTPSDKVPAEVLPVPKP
jgi:NodT family efflux transporter outer membrane factor (OMF) lipoprotein